MDIKLQRLESFDARGSDGRVYRVHGFERMVRDLALPGEPDRWQSTGVAEYRLADGSALAASAGTPSLRLPRTGVVLDRL